MQSTGVYWIPLYEILEEHGLEVYLVNARHTKNLPGRKSDVQESQWLLKLHTYGLLLVVLAQERFLALRVHLVAFRAASRAELRPTSKASHANSALLAKRSHHSSRILAAAAHRSSTSWLTRSK
jgi:transposase